jgi:hypothetical protein
MLKRLPKSSIIEYRVLTYVNFNMEQFEYVSRNYDLTDIAYFTYLQRVHRTSQIKA